jgi:hypothetical protein
MKKTAIIIIVSLLITAAISAGCTDKSIATESKVASDTPVDTFGKPLVVGVPTVTNVAPVTYETECSVLQKDGTVRKCTHAEEAAAGMKYARDSHYR